MPRSASSCKEYHLHRLAERQVGTAPIVIVLPLATGWILAAGTPGWHHLALTVAAALLEWRTRMHVLLMVAAGTVVGALGWI